MNRSERRRQVKSLAGSSCASRTQLTAKRHDSLNLASEQKRTTARQTLRETVEVVRCDYGRPAEKLRRTRYGVVAVKNEETVNKSNDKQNLEDGRMSRKSGKMVSEVKSSLVSSKDSFPQAVDHSLDDDDYIYNEGKENMVRPNVVEEPVTAEDEVLSYEAIRQRNLQDNADFFASLGFSEAKQALQSSVKKKPQPSQRGLKAHKEPQEPPPKRYSLRIRHMDPVGKPLPEPDPIFEAVEESRLPPGPMLMKNCVYSKIGDISDADIAMVSTLLSHKKVAKMQTSLSRKVFQSALEKVAITERRVVKAVPGRVFSVTWYPAASPLISVAGDKGGYIGFWDVTSSDTKDLDIVRVFRPHIKPVSCLYIPPADPHKLYSCSYDATLRCCNFEREVFDEVFSVPEKDDDLFRNFSFVDSASTMLVAQFSGNVSLVDTRTPSTSAEQVYHVSKKSLRTVSVNPNRSQYFITAGLDAKILLWDLRNISSKSPRPVQTLEHHTKAVSSAYFSPSGHKILSCSSDDTFLIYSVDTGMQLDLAKRIRHNNFTGRWLTKFQPNWHPTVEDVFVSGSMLRPRQIEVFDTDGVLLKALADEEFLGSVCSLNAFHPNKTSTLVGANSSGRLHVFM